MARYEDADIQRALPSAAEKLGYSTLRSQQELVVKYFVQGNDVFVSLPTGSGKSLCYTILPYVFDILRNEVEPSIVIIVSPLIALMKDQVRSMTERGLKAVFVGDCSPFPLPLPRAHAQSGKNGLVHETSDPGRSQPTCRHYSVNGNDRPLLKKPASSYPLR